MSAYTDEQRFRWLKRQSTKLKRHLSQWRLSEFFERAVDELMDEQKADNDAFTRKWWGF
jgi:hypothetical protein